MEVFAENKENMQTTPGSGKKSARRTTPGKTPGRLARTPGKMSLPEQVAALSGALRKSNASLRNCHNSLHEALRKENQFRTAAPGDPEGAEHAPNAPPPSGAEERTLMAERKLSEASRQLEALQGKHREVEDLTRERANLESEVAALRRQVAAERAEAEQRLAEERRAGARRVEASEAALAAARDELARESSDVQGALHAARADAEGAATEGTLLRSELAEARGLLAAAERKHEESEAAAVAGMEDAAHQEERRIKAEGERDDALRLASVAETQVAEAAAREAETLARVADTEGRIAELAASGGRDLAAARADVERARAESQDRVEAAERECVEVAAAAAAQAAEAAEALACMEQRAVAAEQDLASVRENVAALERAVASAEQAARAAEAEARVQGARAEEMGREMSGAQRAVGEEAAAARREAEEAAAKGRELEARACEAEKQLAAERTLALELKANFNSSEERADGAETRLAESEERATALMMVQGEAESELAALRAELAAVPGRIEAAVESAVRARAAEAEREVAERVAEASREATEARDRFRKELKERRKIFAQLQELKGSVRVMCRVRPVSEEEASEGCEATVAPSGEEGELEVTQPAEKKHKRGRPGSGLGERRTRFDFDHVFGPETSQEDVFEEVEPLVTSVLDGYHACIFAYGQTGSGKTHTMDGDPEGKSPGINPRTLMRLFEDAKSRAPHMSYTFHISALEIYNEQVRDLLVPPSETKEQWTGLHSTGGGLGAKLEIRKGDSGFHVPGAKVIGVEDADEALEVLDRARSARATSATACNDHSSRSHSMLLLDVRGDSGVTGEVLQGRLVLCDLAGSERVSRSEAAGERLKEAQHINKSLSALGDVVAARAAKKTHVPYRNSALTTLLQDSLGNNGKTLLIVQASPTEVSLQETLCSLAFAKRARGVENGQAKKHVVAAGAPVAAPAPSAAAAADREVKKIRA